MAKKIVVFADGTGNAFTAQQSNIWRLYESLDQTKPDQVAHYIKGVGTSGFKPLAALDGATGFGVPSNVRKLYEFISWNWESGDEIYMFGFSRGAFTIRTLTGLIQHEGLLPVSFPKDGANENVSHAEMRRNAMMAWRSYRSKTTSWTTLPTIWLARLVRDTVVGIWHWLRGHRSYTKVTEQARTEGRDKATIKFVGLFDTVEAYGVPLEEFRRAIDVAIWPISFRNGILCGKVETARHALSLDDERVTFHPLRFDMRSPQDRERIKEVWFAGVHSDVGGGYPEDDLAHVPLTWMISEIGNSLRFIDGTTGTFARNASPYASAHDSRAGLSVFYRYGPRTVGDNGGPPVIHHSVAEKVAFGIERYAPVALPDTAKVLMPDGTFETIKGYDAKAAWREIADPVLRQRMELAQSAVQYLNKPDPAIVSLTLDNIWRRRVAYFALLVVSALVVALPWVVRPAVESVRDTVFPGHETSGSSWQTLAILDQGISAFLGGIVLYISNVVPGYVRPWIDAVVERPTACAIVIGLAFWLYSRNSSLGDRVAELARQAWVPNEKKAATEDEKKKYNQPIPDTIVKKIRESKAVALFECGINRYVLPAIGIVVIYAAIIVAISNSTINVLEGRGDLCAKYESPSPQKKLEPNESFTREGFAIDQTCWPSGILLENGRHYTMSIEMTEPFFDRTIMTDIAGFKDASWPHLVTLPIRRWWTADWFQPIAKINRAGSEAWALISADGDSAVPTGKDAAALRKVYVSNFTAHEDGELILYLNDAIAAIPFGKIFTSFYEDNTGKAKVTIKRLASPPP